MTAETVKGKRGLFRATIVNWQDDLTAARVSTEAELQPGTKTGWGKVITKQDDKKLSLRVFGVVLDNNKKELPRQLFANPTSCPQLLVTTPDGTKAYWQRRVTGPEFDELIVDQFPADATFFVALPKTFAPAFVTVNWEIRPVD